MWNPNLDDNVVHLNTTFRRVLPSSSGIYIIEKFPHANPAEDYSIFDNLMAEWFWVGLEK
jgi:hypothetical protein